MKRINLSLLATLLTITVLLFVCISGTPTVTQFKHEVACRLSVISSPNTGSQANDLVGVAALAPNNVWAVGHYFNTMNHQYALIEHWDGTTWSLVSSPQPSLSYNRLASIAAISSSDIWTVGGYEDRGFKYTLIEHWNGTQWSIVSSPNFTDKSELTGVTAISSNDVWAVGDSTGMEEPNQTLIEHWNGKQWSIVSKGNVAYNGLSAVTALASNDVWAVGGNNTSINPYLSDSQGLIEHWNGSTWSAISTPNNFLESSLFGIAAVSPNIVYAVGNYQDNTSGKFYPLIEQWDGKYWHVVAGSSPGGAAANNLMSIAVVAPNDIWAVGTTYSRNDGFDKILVEHWNGKQWSVVTTPNRSKGSHLNAITHVLGSSQLWSVGAALNDLNNPQDFSEQTLIEHCG